MQLKMSKLYANTYEKNIGMNTVLMNIRKQREIILLISRWTDLMHDDKIWQIKTSPRLKIWLKKGFRL